MKIREIIKDYGWLEDICIGDIVCDLSIQNLDINNAYLSLEYDDSNDENPRIILYTYKEI